MAYPKLTPIVSTGATEPRYIGDRFADVINVRDFGAKGDGVTDDTESLQATFTYAATKPHACVYFPIGEYRISSVVKIGGDLSVYAYGATIRGMGSSDMFSMIQNTLGYDENGPAGYSGNSNVYWYGGTIDGDGQNIDSAIARQQFMFIHSENCHVVDVVFKNARRVHSAEFAGCRNSSIRNCTFLGQYPPLVSDYYPEVVQINPTSEAGTPGFYADDTECENILVSSCVFTNAENSREITESSPYAGCGSHGSSFYGATKNVVIRNCLFKGIRYYGATCYSTHFENWKIENCVFDGVGDTGIKTRNRYMQEGDPWPKSSGFSVVNCRFKNTKKTVDINAYNEKRINSVSLKGLYSEAEGFGAVQNANEVSVSDVEFHLYKNQTTSDTAALYFSNVCNVSVENFSHYCDGFTSNYDKTILFSAGCENFCYENIYCDISTSLSSIAVNNLNGIKSGFRSPASFTAVRGNETDSSALNAAPAVGLRTASAYNAPQIGFENSQAFWIASYEDVNGKNVIADRVFFIHTATGSHAVSPGTDNVQPLGRASNRWKEIHAGTSTISTSDERLKDNVDNPSEALMRAWGKVGYKVFQFKDALEKKGADARLHVGVVAQEVQAAFASEGLDAARYGLFCYDEWPDEFEDVEVVDSQEVLDDEGNIVQPAEKHIEHRQTQVAGNRYGIRYVEALALECAYQRWRLEQIEARLAALEVQ